MDYTVKSGDPAKQRTACILAGVFEKRKLTSAGESVDRASGGFLKKILNKGDLDGRPGQSLMLYGVPGVTAVTRTWPGDRNCYHLMVIRSDRRRELYDHLHSRDILVQVHYNPVHLQPYYRRNFGFKPGDFPHTEQYYAQALSLPLFPDLTEDDQDRVVAAIREVHTL